MSPKSEFLGEFEQMVLLAVLRLGDEAYAVPIREEIATCAGRRIARGAVYTTLERLEAKGCLRSVLGEPVPERGGRSRRYYAVTARGVALLRTSVAGWLKLYRGLEGVLGVTP